MKKEDIEMWDWHRILLGNAPPVFLVEVFLRTIVSFLLLLVILRLLGKKMNGQLNLTETSVMITLGAIISVPMQMPDRGIAVGIVALLCILLFQRTMGWITTKHSRIEALTQGNLSILVKDGVIDLKEMAKAGVSKQELFSALREKQYHNLAQMKRVYFEACGILNVYEEHQKRPGLAVYPSDAKELMDSSEKDREHIACRNCGFVIRNNDEDQSCPHCGKREWLPAIF